MRAPRTLESPSGPEVLIAGRPVLNFCSNDYLGLAAHPRPASAAADALTAAGFGSGASRHITGSHRAHLDCERTLADLVGRPRALLFGSGYAANVGSIPGLLGRGDVIFSDALAHASLIDGCRLSRAAVHIFPHCDVTALDSLLSEHRPRHTAALIVTESLFSMDGDEAPLAELQALAQRHDAGLLVDEAHALGVLGPAGRGLCAATGVVPDLLVGTLGKAFGAAGAFCAGTADTLTLVENRARSYVFSTAPPPALAIGAAAAVRVALEADARRERLLHTADRMRLGLRELGYRVPDGRGPIIPLHVGQPTETMELSSALLQRGVFVHGIRPPTVPDGTSRLRITVMATHTDEHLDRALEAFAAVRGRFRGL